MATQHFLKHQASGVLICLQQSFFLLSRYEEYLPHSKDQYGLYAHENSIAYKEGFLHQPLINIWLEDFRKLLEKKI